MNRNVMLRLFCGIALLLLCAGAALAQGTIAAPPPPGAGTAPPGCDCGPGHWWDVNRKSCVTGACAVPNMPDGDKGGGYFAWHGTLFVDTACIRRCLGNLNLTVTTGQPGWTLVSGPGGGYPITPAVVSAYSGWATLSGASWISVDANRGSQRGAGDYVYEYHFCLCAGAKGMNLSGSFLADNGATVYLNTTQVAVTAGNKNFLSPPKVVSNPPSTAWILGGTNTIKIVVHNESSVTGLAASLTVRADNGTCLK